MLSRPLYVIKYTETTTDVITLIWGDQKGSHVISNHLAHPKQAAHQGGMGGLDYGLNDYHCQIKLKKYKTSENEQSHGSFFLRVGGLGEKN